MDICDQETCNSQRYAETDFKDLIDSMSNRLCMTKSKVLRDETEASEQIAFLVGTEAKPDVVSEPTRYLGVGVRTSPPKRFYRTFWRSIARKALVRTELAERSTV